MLFRSDRCSYVLFVLDSGCTHTRKGVCSAISCHVQLAIAKLENKWPERATIVVLCTVSLPESMCHFFFPGSVFDRSVVLAGGPSKLTFLFLFFVSPILLFTSFFCSSFLCVPLCSSCPLSFFLSYDFFPLYSVCFV